MKLHHIAIVLQVQAESAESILDHSELVAEHLASIDEMADEVDAWHIGVSAENGLVEIDVDVRAEYESDALPIAYAMVRTAISAAGGRTDHWDANADGPGLPHYSDTGNPVSVFG